MFVSLSSQYCKDDAVLLPTVVGVFKTVINRASLSLAVVTHSEEI